MIDGKGMFQSIKSKLKMDSKEDARDFQDRDQDVYDEYDEYDEYDDYDDGYEVSTRGYSSRYEDSSSMPRLVTLGDARESARTTSFSSDSSRDSGRGSSRSTVRTYGRTMVDSSLPQAMTPEGTAALSAASNNRKAEGLDSLFSSTTTPERTDVDLSSALGKRGMSASKQGSSSSSIPLSIPGQRQLQVIRPNTYDDVENVTKVLKTGDAAVLILKNVAPDLAKRLTDFSFGVASALDASVELVGEKSFAITRNEPLSETERDDLKSLNVI